MGIYPEEWKQAALERGEWAAAVTQAIWSLRPQPRISLKKSKCSLIPTKVVKKLSLPQIIHDSSKAFMQIIHDLQEKQRIRFLQIMNVISFLQIIHDLKETNY
jgi:hypothetical protein